MNKDKAIQLLERLQDPEPYEPMLTKDAYDAIQMAIDALSADGDTISREAAIEVIDSFNVFESRSDQIKLEQMIGELPPAQPDVPDINVGDMISRQAALDALNHELRCGAVINQCGLEVAYEVIEGLPPTEPKKGKWIKTARRGRVYYCDQCRNYLDFDGVNAGRGSTNFCPNCGADMRGEQDG